MRSVVQCLFWLLSVYSPVCKRASVSAYVSMCIDVSMSYISVPACAVIQKGKPESSDKWPPQPSLQRAGIAAGVK